MLNRVDPVGPASAYKSYAILAPLPSHWRRANCAEVACPDFERGWRTLVPLADTDSQDAARNSGRAFVETRDERHAVFTFRAGQPCFRAGAHRVRLDRDELFVIRDGDWRGNPSGRQPVVLGSRSWVDDFGEHQDRIITQIERG